MTKYIIKNCENCFYRENGEYFCEFQNESTMFINPCENSTCLLKKIVEKCKNSTYTIRTPITLKKITKIKKTAQDILSMLEIQECE